MPACCFLTSAGASVLTLYAGVQLSLRGPLLRPRLFLLPAFSASGNIATSEWVSVLWTEELEFAFQGLSITIRRRSSAGPSEATASAAAVAASSTELTELARVPLAGATSPASGEAHEYFARRLTGAGGAWTARARIARAVRAGLTAARKLSGAISAVP